MKAIYPVVGGNATAHSYNLVNTSLYQLSFSSGWTHSANGMTPNGTSAYANTGINLSTILTSTNGNLGIYLRSSIIETKADFGVTISGKQVYLYSNYNTTISYGSYPSAFAYSNTGSKIGLFSIGRLSSFDSNVKIIRNGNDLIYNATPSETTLANGNLYLGASNEDGVASNFSSKQNALTYISEGLTPTQVNNLYTLVQAFQTTLGRQV
jgi:hypothetical protein